MAIEIERKFLVREGKLPKLDSGQHFIQGYLSIDPMVRFRMVDDQVTIAIKKSLDGNHQRYEWEFTNKLTEAEREELKTLAVRKIIEKIRYQLPFAGLVWEIDVYQGENLGLITADVELPRSDYPIEFPEWIDSEREIGQDPKYFNVNLGEHPYSEWAGE